MKTSYTFSGKLKLVLFITLCAVVLGCAVLLCFHFYNNNETADISQQTEISAPEREVKAAAARGGYVITVGEFTYDGERHGTSVVVRDPSGQIMSSYNWWTCCNGGTGCVSAGTHWVEVETDPEYAPGMTISQAFEIKPRNISNTTVSFTSGNDFTYDGTAKTPSLSVTDSGLGASLANGADYSYNFSNNVNAGTASVTVTGTGNYTGSATKTFTIKPANISGAAVTLANSTLTYDGTAKTPAVTSVKAGNLNVTSYGVSYSNNTNAGTASVTVTGTGNYTGSSSTTFTINPQDMSSATVKVDKTVFEFNGQYQGPKVVSITLGSTSVTTYNTYYDDSFGVGENSMQVVGRGNYTGTVIIPWKIVPRDISKASISLGATSYTYDGTVKEPSISVTDSIPDIYNMGVQFSYSYSNNVNAGTATVTITGKNNYTGTKSTTFKINARAISNAAIASISAQTYNGKGITPTPAVTDLSKPLANNTDYTFSYSNNTNAGTATVTVTGKGNYSGTKSTTFTINARNISSVSIAEISAQAYSGKAITPTPVVTDSGINKTLANNNDFTFSYSDNTNAGTATVTITGKDNYTGTKSINFTISTCDISEAEITLETDSYDYDGNAKEPSVSSVKAGTNTPSDADYTITYSDNTNAGIATVTVTGKGNYTGTKSVTFKINARDISDVTIAEVSAQTYNGSEIAPTPEVTDGELNKTLVSGTDFAYSYSDNTNAGTATVTVTGGGNYTGSVSVTFTINACDLSEAAVTGIEESYFYTGEAIVPEPAVELDGKTLGKDTDYTITYEENTEAGTAAVTIAGCTNYTGSVKVNFEIIKAALIGFTVNTDNAKTDYTALEAFDVTTVTATAKYSNETEKTISFGEGGYSVIYQQEGDFLQFGDTKVTFSYTENKVTITFDVDELTVAKIKFDSSALVLNPEDTDYNFGNTVTDGIAVQGLPNWLIASYVYEVQEGETWTEISAEEVKNAGTYKITAKFTMDKNHEEVDPMSATFKINPIDPEFTPAVGGSISVGMRLGEIDFSAAEGATAGTLTWDENAYELKEGINRCYYTFTPDDTKNFKVFHGYVDIAAEVPQAASKSSASGSLLGWQVALIIVAVAVVIIGVVTLVIALKLRRATDSDGFYDDATEEQLKA